MTLPPGPKHRQACTAPVEAGKGVPGRYPDGDLWRRLSTLSSAAGCVAASDCFVDKLRPIINRYKLEAVHNIGILFKGFTVPRSPVAVTFHARRQRLLSTQRCGKLRCSGSVATMQLSENKKEAPEKRMLLSMAPQVGLEPTTLRLTVACSTD